MARVRIERPTRSNGNSRRDYALRISRRQGWTNQKTGKTTDDMVLLTIDKDRLDEIGFDAEYARFEIDDEANEFVVIAVEDHEDPDVASWKFRAEKIAKKDTGYVQLFIAEKLLGEFARCFESDRSLDDNELFDISDTEGCPAFSFLIDALPETAAVEEETEEETEESGESESVEEYEDA